MRHKHSDSPCLTLGCSLPVLLSLPPSLLMCPPPRVPDVLFPPNPTVLLTFPSPPPPLCVLRSVVPPTPPSQCVKWKLQAFNIWCVWIAHKQVSVKSNQGRALLSLWWSLLWHKQACWDQPWRILQIQKLESVHTVLRASREYNNKDIYSKHKYVCLVRFIIIHNITVFFSFNTQKCRFKFRINDNRPSVLCLSCFVYYVCCTFFSHCLV